MNRILTALIALPVLIASIVLPYFFSQTPELKLIFVVLAAAAFVLALYEFFTITKKLSLKADAGIGFLGASALFIAFFFDAPAKMPDFLIISLFLFLVILLISQTFRFQKDFKQMFTGIGVTLLGVLYVVFLGGHLVAMRVGFENSPQLSSKLLFFYFLVLMLGDALALYTGKLLGKHKLAPNISPGKTWEGCIGGLLASLAAGAAASFTFFPELQWFVALPLAAVMNVLGVLGDLTESAMKRGADVKDAANILPGHGGILDRLDSLLFSAPLLYYFARVYFQ
jgi:phosphatidate cytidylyltransferase